MAKHDAKPKSETVGKNRMCLSCFHCKTRIFRDIEELFQWCIEREHHSRIVWHSAIGRYGKVQLYWCVKHPSNPRILRKCDKPFAKNCKLYNGGD